MTDPMDYLLGRDPGWYIVNQGDGHVKRGPYRYLETANAVRAEIERHATARQLELWNLIVLKATARRKKP